MAVRGDTGGILVIGSYIYHLDVIVSGTHIYVNIIQIHLTYYSPVYCIYKLVQLSQCSSDNLVVYSVDSKEFRMRTL